MGDGLGKVIVIEHLTRDGVMQAPGHSDEDRRDGFELVDSATTGTGVLIATYRPVGSG